MVGRFHLHGTKGVLPVLPDRFKRSSRAAGRSSEAMHQTVGHHRRLVPTPSLKMISRS